jgi:hypothetical protein
LETIRLRKNNLNPTTLQQNDKERKCEKLWTLPYDLISAPFMAHFGEALCPDAVLVKDRFE